MPGWTPPPLDPAARARLDEGRGLLAAGQRAAAIAAFGAAFRTDPGVACHPWGLLPHLEAEGRGNLRVRLKARMDTWYRSDAEPRHPLAGLGSKPGLRRWAEAEGVPVARLIARADGLDSLDWAALPRDGIVIKPANATERRGVVALRHGIDRFTGTDPGADLQGYVAGVWAKAGLGDRPVLVEELLVEADPPPGVVIARDIKGYAVNGRVATLLVTNRNVTEGDPYITTVDRLGRPVLSMLRRYDHCAPQSLPAGFAGAVALIEDLSARLPWLIRVDTYATPRGPILGEITTFPNAGLGYAFFGRRTLLQMWELHPD